MNRHIPTALEELSAPPTILCNSCGLAVSVGHLCVFCAGDAKPEREATRPRAEQVGSEQLTLVTVGWMFLKTVLLYDSQYIEF